MQEGASFGSPFRSHARMLAKAVLVDAQAIVGTALKPGNRAARLMAKRVCWPFIEVARFHDGGAPISWSSPECLATVHFSATLLTNPGAILTLLQKGLKPLSPDPCRMAFESALSESKFCSQV